MLVKFLIEMFLRINYVNNKYGQNCQIFASHAFITGIKSINTASYTTMLSCYGLFLVNNICLQYIFVVFWNTGTIL